MTSSFGYDDRLTITTPEGVDLTLTLAGVGSRFIAALIDALIEGAVLIAGVIVLSVSNGFGTGSSGATAIFLVFLFVLVWGYDVAFEVLASGRTPGKRWNGLRVVREGGQPVGFVTSAVRNVMRLIDWLPSFYLVGIVAVFVTAKNQRLGDVVAGTIVVRDGGARALAPDARWSAPAGVVLEGESWDVSSIGAEELAAVRGFLERRGAIDYSARSEIAAMLAARLRPKVGGAPADLPAERFLEIVADAKTRRG
jgi:uncharacterized RDD family membrane protein YckC